MKLDQRSLDAALQQTRLPLWAVQQGYQPLSFQIQVFETVSSTNRLLWELIQQGAGAGTVAIAQQQEAGRGQWGRQWRSPPGGLYLSLCLTPDLSIHEGGQLTLCSAWGIAATLREHGIPVALKWPNDLVVEGLKLGGILTETRLQQERITHAVMGVGINWENDVPETGISLKTIQARQLEPSIQSLEAVGAIALHGIVLGYWLLQQQGIQAVVAAYESLLTSLGRRVTVAAGSGSVVGVAESGDLRVQLEIQTGGQSSSELYLKPGTVSLGYT